MLINLKTWAIEKEEEVSRSNKIWNIFSAFLSKVILYFLTIHKFYWGLMKYKYLNLLLFYEILKSWKFNYILAQIRLFFCKVEN